MTDSSPQNPLDEALRRELTEYGEAPSPRVWAGVRRNLPAAPPLRARRRRRLTLLLGLLFVLMVASQLLFRGPRPGAEELSQGNGTALEKRIPPASDPAELAQSVSETPHPIGSVLEPAPQQASGGAAAAHGVTRPGEPGPAPETTDFETSETGKRGVGMAGTNEVALAPAHNGGSAFQSQVAVVSSSKSKHALTALSASPAQSKNEGRHTGLTTLAIPKGLSFREKTHHPVAAASSRPAVAPGAATATRLALSEPRATTVAAVPAATPISQSSTSTIQSPTTHLDVAEPASRTTASKAAFPTAVSTVEPASYEVQRQEAASFPEGVARLAYRELETSSWALPTPLVPGPDSVQPTRPAGPRWAVLAVGGPTISYRTLHQPLVSGGSVYDSRLSRQERPAPGWGAQVQVRRVLSGRWALAAGIGYQQYATSLAVEVVQTLRMNGSVQAVETVHNRDTYNLLVLPVQFTYTLGIPRGSWQVAALGGLEPGRYLGGLNTRANPPLAATTSSFPSAGAGYSYDISQRSSSPSDASPYQTWNLGVSLGLDLRYRPAPASRWQVVAQPTGRYITTPFALDSAPDYSRHPFSLGLLVGLSWDVRQGKQP